MKVHGVEITEPAKELAAAEMRARFPSGFALGNLVHALERAGVPSNASYRAADRLLQEWRKSGRVEQKARAVWLFKAEGQS